jgi:hypothetical protein
MIGYVAATAEARLQSLTVGSLTDRLGLASAPVGGELVLHPAFHTAQGLANMSGNKRYRCSSSRPGCVTAVAGEDREGCPLVWLANLTGQKQEAVLEWGGHATSVQLLDEESLSRGEAEPWRQWKIAESIPLLPYALACVRFISV